MRVISGKYKGRKLREFDLSTTKPTLDRVKESIFDLVQFEVEGACVLDLFAGTGALGLEAASRGARRVYLVDSNKQAVKIIKENFKNVSEDFVVQNTDYLTFLDSTREKFDLIFLDPPFDSDLGVRSIKRILNKDLLNPDGTIVFETAADRDFDFSSFNLKVDRRKYGSVAVYILRPNPQSL